MMNRRQHDAIDRRGVFRARLRFHIRFGGCRWTSGFDGASQTIVSVPELALIQLESCDTGIRKKNSPGPPAWLGSMS